MTVATSDHKWEPPTWLEVCVWCDTTRPKGLNEFLPFECGNPIVRAYAETLAEAEGPVDLALWFEDSTSAALAAGAVTRADVDDARLILFA